MPNGGGSSVTRRTLCKALLGAAATLNLPAITGNVPQRPDSLDPLGDVTVPAAPFSDALIPFHGSAGTPFTRRNPDEAYPKLTVRETAEALAPLDPDGLLFFTHMNLRIADLGAFNTWRSGLLTYALDTPISTVTGPWIKDAGIEWYQDWSVDQKYEWPDGTTVDDLTNLSAVAYSGEPHDIFGNKPVLSPFAPGTIDLMTRRVEPAVTHGYSWVMLDGTTIGTRQGLDFSRWALESFRTYLQQQSTETLDAWGIDDLSNFDMREYIQANLRNTDTPAKDPVFRAYRLHQYRQQKHMLEETISRIDGLPHPAESLSFYPNLGTGSDLQFAPATSVHLADAFDVVTFESYGDQRPVPPHHYFDYRYKLWHAAGRFEKRPILLEGDVYKTSHADAYGLDSDLRYTTLMQLQVAEAFTNGGRIAPDLFSAPGQDPDTVLNRWINIDGSIPPELPDFVDFIRGTRRFHENISPNNRVAVLFSLPTMVWNDIPQAGWGSGVSPTQYLDSFIGAAAILRDHHLPYDVVIFDHPELWEAPSQLDRLSAYDVLVLPQMDVVADAHVQRISGALKDGTTVIVSGTPPEHSVIYEQTAEARDLLNTHENAVIFEDDPATQYKQDSTGGEAIISAIDERVDRQLDVSTTAPLGVNVFSRDDAAGVVVHLLNYDYDPGTDTVTSHGEITVTLRGLSMTPETVQWYTQEDVQDLAFERPGDGIRFRVPTLDIWGFAVISPQSSVATGDSAKADAAIEDANTAVTTATNEDRIEDLYHAKQSLGTATAARTYGAYDQAEASATRASSEAEQAYQTPVVGLDTGHGQSTNLDPVREAYSDFEYQTVSTWTSDALNGLDLLVVPPALSFNDETYGFSASELDAVTQFVKTGGSLAVIARGGADAQLNDLLAPFGYEVPETGLLTGPDNSLTVDISFHLLTRMVSSVRGAGGLPLTSLPDDATILANVAGDSDGWFNVSQPKDEMNGEDWSAAKAPLFAVSSFGDGVVAYLGNTTEVRDPTQSGGPLRNMIEVLGQHARYAHRQSTSSDTASPTETTITSPTSQGAQPSASATPPPTTAGLKTQSAMGDGETSTPDDADGESDDAMEDGETSTPDDADGQDSNDIDNVSDADNDEAIGEGGPGFGVGSALTGIGGAGYLLKRRLTDTETESK